MKSFLLSTLLILLLGTAKAQTLYPGGSFNNFSNQFSRSLPLNDSLRNKKWFLNKYSGLAAGFIGFPSGYATTVSAPIGVQLNRRITNNVYAFGGVSIAPTYINFRHSFLNTDFNKAGSNSTFLRSNKAALFPRAELGLSYINDERTFQISGSMSVQRVPNDYYLSIPAPNSLLDGRQSFNLK